MPPTPRNVLQARVCEFAAAEYIRRRPWWFEFLPDPWYTRCVESLQMEILVKVSVWVLRGAQVTPEEE